MKRPRANGAPEPMNSPHPMNRHRTMAAALHELAAAARRFAEQCGPTNHEDLWSQAAHSLADLLGLAAAEIAPANQSSPEATEGES